MSTKLIDSRIHANKVILAITKLLKEVNKCKNEVELKIIKGQFDDNISELQSDMNEMVKYQNNFMTNSEML